MAKAYSYDLRQKVSNAIQLDGMRKSEADSELKDRIYAPEVIINLTWGAPDNKTLYMTGMNSLYRTRLSVGELAPSRSDQERLLRGARED